MLVFRKVVWIISFLSLGEYIKGSATGSPYCTVTEKEMSGMGGSNSDLGFNIALDNQKASNGKYSVSITGNSSFQGVLVWATSNAKLSMPSGNFKTVTAKCPSGTSAFTHSNSSPKKSPLKFTVQVPDGANGVELHAVVAKSQTEWQILKPLTINSPSENTASAPKSDGSTSPALQPPAPIEKNYNLSNSDTNSSNIEAQTTDGPQDTSLAIANGSQPSLPSAYKAKSVDFATSAAPKAEIKAGSDNDMPTPIENPGVKSHLGGANSEIQPTTKAEAPSADTNVEAPPANDDVSADTNVEAPSADNPITMDDLGASAEPSKTSQTSSPKRKSVDDASANAEATKADTSPETPSTDSSPTIDSQENTKSSDNASSSGNEDKHTSSGSETDQSFKPESLDSDKLVDFIMNILRTIFIKGGAS